MTAQPELPIDRPDPAVRGRCRWCSQPHTLIGGRLPTHPTQCSCLGGGHPPGRRCPFETTCPGSGKDPLDG